MFFFEWFCAASHGFRMPLFFLISGFFTTMILKKYGLKTLLLHRFKRIFLPCVVAVLIFGSANKWVVVHSTKLEQARLLKDQGFTQSPVEESLAFSLGSQGIDIQYPTYIDAYYELISESLFTKSFFSHMWFLWFLCLLIILFAVIVRLSRLRQWAIIPKPISRFKCLLILIPATYCAQYLMHKGEVAFGPDTSIGLLPYPHTLLYYSIFYLFGAYYFQCEDKVPEKMTPTILTIIICLSLVLLVKELHGTHREFSNILQVLYAWLMVFCCMDLFRFYLNKENSSLRYLSDASYWLYLAHLPLVFLAQHLLRHLPFNIFAKFLIINILVFLVLFISYHFFVRSSFIGLFLNGRRYPGKKT